MDMSGSYRVTAPREEVWAALNDPAILKQCIPGCEEIEKQSDTEMTAKVTAKVGPVKAKFAGKVTLSDIDPPNGYTISGEGTGGAAGFGKGGAAVKLMPDGDGATVLEYTAHAQVGGKLAQIGSRLIDGTARKMADDFFAKFSEVVGGPQDAGEPAAAPEGRPESAPAPAPAAVPGGQMAAQPAAMAAFASAGPAEPRAAGDEPVDLRLVGMVALAVIAFTVILYTIAGS
ncbi:SRPBCC family protein [Skermanella pratensis]|uniref:SRPBCC family protein n=1 Tax=Skermanella pratensis TaxID=2233999 RepID=UPI001300CDE0|nr:carbon monoxide dehydrogenase subunit G [Skermanella pratensis]